MNLLSLSLCEACDKLRTGAIGAVELTQAYQQAIAERNPDYLAYITTTPQVAMQMAESAQKKISEKKGGAVTGIPLAIKDLFATKNIKTTAGSRILENFIPPYESTVTDKLWQGGAVLLGKTNMDEFAMGSATNSSFLGATINPWSGDEQLTAGGSSGGSAGAVAGLMALGALGSDTGGSIRQPCALTGLVGVKPTYGACSRYGMVAFASSLDQAGVMVRDVADAALLLSVMVGHDEKDSTSAAVEHDTNKWQEAVKKGKGEGLQGLRVAEGAWQNNKLVITMAGKEIGKDLTAIFTRGLETYYIIAPAEASSNLARYDGVRYGVRKTGKDLQDLYQLSRHDGFGAEVKRRILLGTFVLSAGYYDAYFQKAQLVRRLLLESFQKLFQECDILLLPATPTDAFALNQKMDPITMYQQDIFTIPISLAGLPAGVVPTGLSDKGLPQGIQVVAPHFGEEKLFWAMAGLEQQYGFDIKKLLWQKKGWLS